MSNVTINPEGLAEAIQQELTIYGESVEENIRAATRECMVELVRKTRATAPARSGAFKRHIAGDFRGLKKGDRKIKATWYVKAPEHRLTHLLVHGHAKPDGGRTKADPFLQNALDEVLPRYEQAVKEAVQNAE